MLLHLPLAWAKNKGVRVKLDFLRLILTGNEKRTDRDYKNIGPGSYIPNLATKKTAPVYR